MLGPLLPRSCPTRFWGRHAERDRLRQWCRAPGALGLLVLEGPGGCGRTRLALQAADEAAEDGWAVGWLGEGQAAGLVDAVAAAPGAKVLTLVDDADTRSDLSGLLDALAGYRSEARLRVVLIARQGGVLPRVLKERLTERHVRLLTDAAVLAVPPQGESSDLIRWHGEAARAFATACAMPVPPISATIAPVRPGRPMADVLAQAMVAVLRQAAPRSTPAPLDEVARTLFEHEALWWRATAVQERWAPGPVTDLPLTRVMAALALFSPVSEQDAVAVLRRIPELADSPAEQVAALGRWARALYPAAGGFRIGPDLLADWFITTSLTHGEPEREFARHLLTGLSEDQAVRVLTVLARAGEHHPSAHLLFTRLLDGDPRRLASPAVIAALATTRDRDLDQAIATALTEADPGPDATARLRGLVPEHTLPRTALALARHHLLHVRVNGDLADVARALIGLATASHRLGRYPEQLHLAREAVGLCRTLVAEDPVHRAALALALTTHASGMERLGRDREASEALREAVDLYRGLAAGEPAHRPALARALINIAVVWGGLGRRAEQLRAAREAVELYRGLAGGDPSHRLALARALINLTSALDDSGRHTEQAQVAREAVELYREQAAGNPAHRLYLARALYNLTVTMDRLGRHGDQVEVAREAATVWRQLAAEDPGRFHDQYVGIRRGLRRLLARRSDEGDALAFDL
ncbi:ATP-binding protein [Actinomadura soli]|uniref:ATP-binding protein n=1 Tax=Actinomadura soli TaxID=2508997 RepID=A0A5C4JEW1_9ACTN|nr:tetratricopeptide repeat protein [Actinomadura soli]TMR01582.1 ATP-binding protein [Actinomadura soli]